MCDPMPRAEYLSVNKEKHLAHWFGIGPEIRYSSTPLPLVVRAMRQVTT
jgi:hypothetical protein